MLRFWTRARRLLWSWWPWAAAFLYAMVHDQWGWAMGMGAMALVSYLIAPHEFPPRYGLDHEFSRRRRRVPADDGGRDRRAVHCPATASTS